MNGRFNFLWHWGCFSEMQGRGASSDLLENLGPVQGLEPGAWERWGFKMRPPPPHPPTSRLLQIVTGRRVRKLRAIISLNANWIECYLIWARYMLLPPPLPNLKNDVFLSNMQTALLIIISNLQGPQYTTFSPGKPLTSRKVKDP